MTSPSDPEFWNSRYLAGQTPWEFKGVPEHLRAFLKKKPARSKDPAPLKRGRVLIPGCGSGYEIKAFADAGYEVTAIDFSPAAVERARKIAGPALADRVMLWDFFNQLFEPQSFDLVYERTFLCSLPPERRTEYRDRVATLLKHGGMLVGYFYYNKPDPKAGPPYGFAWGTSDELFGRHFLLLKDEPVEDSVPLFAGRERWQEQRRTAFNG